MSISGIPNSFGQPGVYVNLTINDATSSSGQFNVLIIGQAAAGSNYATNPALYPVTSLSQLATDFGTSSDVYKIASAYTNIDNTTPLYALNCIAGTTTQTTSNGTIETINSVLSTTTSSSDMASSSVAGSGGSGSGATFAVTSSTNDDKTAFTPASVSIVSGGNGYKVGDKITIANVGTITVLSLDSETVTVPESDLNVLTTALANVGNVETDIILGTYNSASAIQAIATHFESTWGYLLETYGQYFTVEIENDQSVLIANGANFNSVYASALAIPTELDEYLSLGNFVAQVSNRTQNNPALPLRDFALNSGTVSIANRLNVSAQQTLFDNGYCTVSCDSAGNPTVSRTRIGATVDSSTGLTLNDPSLETRFQSVYVAKAFKSALAPYISSPYIIMSDDDVVAPSPYLVTPSKIRSACIAAYSILVNELVCTDLATFKDNLTVSIDPDVIGRVNVVMTAYLSSGLAQITINLATTK
ncbi:hypothetical protein [Gluconobacter frateurii]|uniref:Uncharacterized protein n=1 Tax=Gluconobacter frateurii NRIC 0228 TaxID=1307946 RepID=A0ABQ0QFI6_9PROT|nr:hypothetical protein [Gluconobacter frateurii]GBR17469.1 hypothetical protein AA0228_3035 [Gluconobacter frateurii NRIC 0228]GLP89613.1 hypothetical protein GCM10007868_06880 [Gluconobacter frateurii]